MGKMTAYQNEQKTKINLYSVLVRLKGCLNFSQTMNFVPDFHHRLTIGPV